VAGMRHNSCEHIGRLIFINHYLFAIRRKYALCARNGALIMAHVAVLGLQFYYGYYQFFGLSTYRSLYFSHSLTATHSIASSRVGWDKNSRRALLLDKRFSHEHVWCCPAPFFFLPYQATEQKRSVCRSQIHAHTAWLRLLLRGPPNGHTIA
jgi:hypothetical protein